MSQRLLSEKNDFSLRNISELSKSAEVCSATQPSLFTGQKSSGQGRIEGMFSVGLKATHKLNSDSKTAAAEEAAKAFRFRPVNSVPQAAVASRPRASPLSVGGNFTKTDSQVSQLNAELRNLKSVVSNERRLSHTTIEDLRARLEVANASYQEAVRDLASSRHERSHLVSRDKFDQALAAVMKADAILVEKDAQLAAFSKKANEKSATSDDLQNKMQEIKDLRVLLTETETKQYVERQKSRKQGHGQREKETACQTNRERRTLSVCFPVLSLFLFSPCLLRFWLPGGVYLCNKS